VEITAIGTVYSSRSDAVDDGWDGVVSRVALDPTRFSPDSLEGLEDFSHIEVVYFFDRVDAGEIVSGARHPRENPEWPAVGIFAQRAKCRPNRLGVTICALVGVDGLTVTVRGLDAIDGTPVVDIKPYMAEFGPRGPVWQPSWSHELMSGYW